MLDKPEKTHQLVATLKAALPFDVVLTPDLASQQNPIIVKSTETVSEISYAGDEGGILCHLQPEDAENVIIVSLTHVRMHRSLPLAAAVFDYQKHRVKKLKKQGSA